MGRASASSSRSPSMQGRICQVCGDIGQNDMLVTCSGCRSASEHTYCAQAPPPPNQPGAWFCESCRKEQGSSGVNLSSLNGQLPYRSAPLVWKGSLKVFQLAGYLIVGLSAYLPLQVSRRLYSATQTLPAELETKTVARSTTWPKQFQTNSPNYEDIGIFLLPSDRRSSLKCMSLIRQLDSGRYALKMKISSCIELVIYSSQVLEENCQRLRGDLFLWGLFWKRNTRSGLKRAEEAESGREARQFTAPNLSDNEAASYTTPQQPEIPAGFGTSCCAVIEHDDEPLVPPPAGLDIPPGRVVNAEERKDNNFNQNLPFTAGFRTSNRPRQVDPITVDVAQPLTVQNISSSSGLTNSQALRVTIADLLRYDGYSSTDKQFQCVAQIVAINNPYNWFYESCFNCHKKLRKDGAHQWYWCPYCNKWRERPVLWYFLALQVADNTATTEFKLFGKQAESIVGVPASRVWHEPNPNGYLVPPTIGAVIRKTATFTVKFDLGSLDRGCVSFIVCRADAVPPDAQLPAQEAPPLPVQVTPLPLPRRDIAESSGHAMRDNGKRKIDESLPAERQLGDEPDSTHSEKRPFIFSQGYQARR